MGSVEKLRHKVEVLRGHCEAVGRDFAEIELTAGCKPIIRDTEAEARRLWEAQMAHNRTPMSDVENDDTFWVGTPEQVAAQMIERRELGFTTFLAEMAAPYDDETLERWIGEVKPMVERRVPEWADRAIRDILGVPMFKFLSRLGDSNEREVRALEPIVERINLLEPEVQALTDAELAGRDR